MLIPIGFFGGGGAANSYELISTQVLGGATSSITFSSIPQTYKHLQIRYSAKSVASGSVVGLIIRLNGDSGASSYYNHWIYGNGSSSSSSNLGTTNQINISNIIMPTYVDNRYSPGIINLTDYTSTAKSKTVRVQAGALDSNNSIFGIIHASGMWNSTAAVTSITLSSEFVNTQAGSRFSLYGIKG